MLVASEPSEVDTLLDVENLASIDCVVAGQLPEEPMALDARLLLSLVIEAVA